MQREGDERRVLQVHAIAETAGLHPCAERDRRSVYELQRLDQFVQRFEDVFLRQLRGLQQPGTVLGEFYEKKPRRKKNVISDGDSRRSARSPQPAASVLKTTFVSTTTRMG